MADRTESPSSMVTQQGMSETNRMTTGAGSARSVVAEFMDAARSTAESLLEEQKQQIADRVKGIAEGLEAAARSLDGSQNRIVARYVEQAGDQVRNFAHSLHGRRWNEVLADTEDFARRQPTLFVLGAVATGFVVGRFLWTAMDAPSRNAGAMRESSRRETAREVTAAISSAPGAGRGTGEPAGFAAGSSGMMESR